MTATDTIDSHGWRVVLDGAPPTANVLKRLHWAKQAEITRAWRDLAHDEAIRHECPRFDTITVAVRRLARRSAASHPRDVDALAPIAKAIIDGLVDAHVIPDDSPDHVISVTLLPTLYGARDGVEVWIEPADPVSPTDKPRGTPESSEESWSPIPLAAAMGVDRAAVWQMIHRGLIDAAVANGKRWVARATGDHLVRLAAISREIEIPIATLIRVERGVNVDLVDRTFAPREKGQQ